MSRRRAVLATLATLILLALQPAIPATAAAKPALPRDPTAAVSQLLVTPPYLVELEKVVGDLKRDRTVWDDAWGPLERAAPSPLFSRVRVEFQIDPFHEDGRTNENPRIDSYHLGFRSGRAACRPLLAAKAAPQRLVRDGAEVWRFGDFYVEEGQGQDDFKLSWYDQEPLFAIPERGEAATAELIANLAAVAKEQFSRASIEKFFGPLATDAKRDVDLFAGPTFTLDLSPAGAAYPKRFHVFFKRALPGAELFAKLGYRRPAVIAPDIHMSSRELVELVAYEDDQEEREKQKNAPRAARTYGIEMSVESEGLEELEKEQDESMWSAENAKVSSFYAALADQPGPQDLALRRHVLKPAPAPEAEDHSSGDRVRDSASSQARYAGGVVPAPRRVHYVKPAYNEVARRARVQGVVIAELTIDPQGRVSEARILKSLPMRLDEQAQKALLEWRYEPTLVNGKPVEVLLNVTLDFAYDPSPKQRVTKAAWPAQPSNPAKGFCRYSRS